MKYIANLITITRIILSVFLICFINNKPIFAVIYIICGLSDAVDGIFARKTNTVSTTGAKLDSLADLFMFVIATAITIIWVGEDFIKYLPLIYIIVLLRIINLIIGACKYHTIAMLHTWGNKLTGFLVFLAPILYISIHNIKIIIPICIVSILAAIEESIIHLKSNKLDLNYRSIFFK